MEKKCLQCGATDQQVPLVALSYQATSLWICPGCLPILIHHPDRLAGKLGAPESGSQQSTKG